MKIFFVVVLNIAFVFSCGCASRGSIVEEVPLSLRTIRRVVTSALPNGLAKTSPNGRELFSNYYDPYDPLRENFDDVRKRSMARVIILGVERPYQIRVEVILERRRRGPEGYRFEPAGFDIKAQEALALRLRLRLEKTRDSVDFIDDFRAF